MDSLTHLVAGALTPLAFRHSPKRAAVVGFGIAAGELPDIDVFFGTSPEALMVLHRGITHALFWQPVLALLVTVPFYIWMCGNRAAPCRVALPPGPGPRFHALDGQGNPAFLRMWLMALTALCVHIYLDCMTTFGTQALLPFSSLRVGLPAMFIVDLLLTLPAMALLALALRQKAECAAFPGACPGVAVHSARARRFAVAGLAWILFYPLLALGVNAAANAALGPRLVEEAGAEPACARRVLLTEPFSPFVWKAVVDDGERLHMGVVSLFAAGDTAFTDHAKPDPALYAALKRQEPLFAYFEEFAPLMTQTKRPAGPFVQADYAEAVTEYSFADLRYIAAPESVSARVGRGDPMFVMEARVNASGALLAYRFLKRSADAAHTPWVTVE